MSCVEVELLLNAGIGVVHAFARLGDIENFPEYGISDMYTPRV